MLKKIKFHLTTYSSYLQYFFEVIADIFRFRSQAQVSRLVLYRQILFTGYEAMKIIILMGVVIGAIIVLEGNAVLPGFSQSKFFYTVLVGIVTRELSSVLTGFIIAARSGTAISTELGNMVVNKEIEAVLSFGMSPIAYLVSPRVFGVFASMVILTIYFNVAAIIGAWFVSNFFVPISITDYFYNIFNEFTGFDFFTTFAKSFSFGLIIGTVSTYQGLQVEEAITEVPQRTIKSVVYSMTGIILVDIVITALYYLS